MHELKRYEILAKIINENKLKSVAEIGVRDGETMFYILDNCPTVEVYYAVDVNREAKFLSDPRLDDRRIVPQIGYSVEIAAHFALNELDLVYIDADHSEANVADDIRVWLPKIKETGFITGHDYENPAHRGVKAAVDRAFGERVQSYQDGAYLWAVKLNAEVPA